MKEDKQTKIKVLVYSDSINPVVADKIREANDHTIDVEVIESVSDAILYHDIDVVIVEGGAYRNIITDITVCNHHLSCVPVLAIIPNDEPPQEENINFVLTKEATANVITQMIKILYKKEAILNECPLMNKNCSKKVSEHEKKSPVDKEQVAKDLAQIQQKYMPELIKIRDEIANSRGQNA